MEENPMELKEYKDIHDSVDKYKHRSTKNDFIFKKSNWDMMQKSFNESGQE